MRSVRLRLRRAEDGGSAVEYALIAVAIAAAIVVAVFALGGGVRGLFTNTCSSIVSVQGGSC